jgi:DNA repair protein RecO (recombination protein O)
MRSFKTEGIVIKRKNFHEADRILTIFTKTRGKILVKAKGVRKITSRRAGHIELLNCAIFNLYQGNGLKGMPILTEVESLNNYSVLKKDLRKIGIAYHICELADALCAENQENEEIFTLLTQALEMISKDDRLDLISHRFELKLLKLLGFSTDVHKLNKEETENFIESILERRLKTKQILPQLS